MAAGLPEMIYGDGITKRGQIQFGGYNHNRHAGDGEIYDMQNLTSDSYPLLSPRISRNTLGEVFENLNGIYMRDGKIYIIDKTTFFEYRQTSQGIAHIVPEGVSFKDSKKTFTAMGDNIIIMPDKICWNINKKTFKKLEASRTGAAKLQDGTYAGKEAKANTIYMQDAKWSEDFKEGDGVTISGCKNANNNKTFVVREISGDYLRFYENTFTIPEDGSTENITVERKVPTFSLLCQNENRLWGCEGNTVYASKLGDPFNWNVFDGLSTDSYAADVGSAGAFTGCTAYLGYPCFFKEEHIYKVYGDRPANFQIMGSASQGVAKGSEKSLAVAGETLFYLSGTGIVAYTGGMPKSLAAPFGNIKYKNAVAGSDGVKYFVSMEAEGENHLFVYDTQKGLWHKEDKTKAFTFIRENGRLFCAEESGTVWYYGESLPCPLDKKKTETVESFAEFGDFTDGDPNKKGTGKLQIRMELAEGASVTVSIRFDTDSEWQTIKTLTATKKRSFYLPIIPRRADHYRVKIEGKGQWWIHSFIRESYAGSEI